LAFWRNDSAVRLQFYYETAISKPLTWAHLGSNTLLLCHHARFFSTYGWRQWKLS